MSSKPFGSKSRPFGGGITKPAPAPEPVVVHQSPEPQQAPNKPPPEVLDLALYLGIDPREDPDLLWVAEECLAAELPSNWTEHVSSRGDVYFYNSETDESTVKHPLEDTYRQIYEQEKDKKMAKQAEEEAWSSMEGAGYPTQTGLKPVAISAQEVLDMCAYYNVQPESETFLLQTMRQAVLAPLPWMFREVLDRKGNPYFYNVEEDESQRTHPLDAFFQERIQELRDAAEDRPPLEDNGRSDWQVFFTSHGLPIWYNFGTGEEQRGTAPVGVNGEAVIRDQIEMDHQSANMQPFGDPPADMDASNMNDTGLDYTQDGADPYEGIDDKFVQEYSEMLGLRPSDPKLQKFVREMHEQQQAVENNKEHWTTDKYEDHRIDLQAPKMRPAPAAPKPKHLVFFSWWFEEGIKKYIELRYDMHEKIFHIVLNKTVALKEVKIAGRDGELLQCWDLYVGQKIDVLGKPTTLMQATHATLQWLEFHSKRLLRKAMELENEIMQFKQIPDVIHRINHSKNLSNGSISLRWIMKHISVLTTQLYRLKPAAAK